MPVVNLNWTRGNCSDDWIRVHRGTMFGNPYSHHENTEAAIIVRTREEAVRKFCEWLLSDLEIPGWSKPSRAAIKLLDGQILACFCAPSLCHGEVLLELAAKWAAEDLVG